jgi:GT2 family glycosyltransferase
MQDDHDTPKVDIIVLNWNSYEDTSNCLRSLERIDYPRYKVTVIDNGSTDNSGERLSAEFGQADFIFNDDNMGFAGGCNVGINQVTEGSSPADYVLLLNNDTVVESDFLDRLVCVAEKHEDIACVGGVINDSSGQVWFAGGRFIPYLCRGSHIQEVESDEPYETDFVTGAMMLVDSGFLSSHGGLNEDYFFGMEDLDLCLTAQEQDLKLLISPEARATHNVSSSAGRRSPFKYYHSTRNRLQLASNHLSMKYKIFFYVLFAITRFARGTQWGLSGRFDLIRSVWSAIADHRDKEPFKKPEDFSHE